MEGLLNNPQVVGAAAGTCVGLLGALVGTLCGVFAGKGKHRRLVLGLHLFSIALCGVLLICGVLAFTQGKPYGVWYGLGFPGLLGMIIFGSLWPVIRRAYRQAEMRKPPAQDMQS